MTTGLIAPAAVVALMLWTTAALGAGGRADARPAKRPDPHSYGNPEQIRVKRVELDLSADFERRALSGSATLTVERQPGCPPGTPLDLDTRGLTIESVSAGPTDAALAPAAFRLGADAPAAGDKPTAPTHLGTRLRITLPDDASRVRIVYRTGPDSSALQWLKPEMTEIGRAHV